MGARMIRSVSGLLAACGAVLGIWAAAHATSPYIPTVDELIGRLGDDEPRQRCEAALNLGSRGKEALSAVPVLEKAKEADPDPEVRLCALWAVALVRAAPLEAQRDREGARALLAQCEARLIAALKAEEPGVRARAAQLVVRSKALGRSEDAMEALLAALSDPNPSVRAAAAQSLAAWRNERVADALIKALQDPHAAVRSGAAYGLANTSAQAAVVPLAGALSDANWEVRRAAAWALGSCAGSPEAIRPAERALLKALRDQSPWRVRRRVAGALGNLRGTSEAAVAALVEALADSDAEVRESAAEALGRTGPHCVKAVPALVAAVKDERNAFRRTRPVGMGGEIRIRERAARALANIGEPAVPGLIECLETPISAVRVEAARALREIGPDAKAAVPALKKALNDENAEVRSAAAQALENISRPQKEPAGIGFGEAVAAGQG